MKKLNVIFTIMAVAMFMLSTSCGDGENSSSSDNPIIGKWKILKAEGSSASSNEGTIYDFIDDSNAKVGTGAISSEYKYTVKGDTLSMDYQGGGAIVLDWIFSIDGDKMTMDKASAADQKFWLEKQ